MKAFKFYILLLFLIVQLRSIQAQILFAEDCYIGGIATSGLDNIGVSYGNTCEIKWEDNYTLRKAYAISYRYGRPHDQFMQLNGSVFEFTSENQAGPEQIETNTLSNYFAPHVAEITSNINIEGSILTIDFPFQVFQEPSPNWGWWGVYFIIQYESPNISAPVCSRIYIADQSQLEPQNYQIEKPNSISSNPIIFAIHSSRLSNFYIDRSRVEINSTNIGEIYGGDYSNPEATSGVQGHFYYENGFALGLNGDSANTTISLQDGVANINQYLSSFPIQNMRILRVEPSQFGGFNPHPSFNLTYTPSCALSNEEMDRSYSFCKLQSTPRGEPDITDAIQLNALPSYDNYGWTPSSGLSDATIRNPFCYADSSGWYRVRMWNDDEGGLCSQTIPVFVIVGKVPRPGNLQVRASFCPQNTGRIVFGEMAGKAPFQYRVNGNTKTTGTFENLAPGTYDISVTDALGCTWDSTAVVALDPIQTAAFTANPDSGYSPLRVVLTNQSTEATDYIWLVNGTPFSNSTNTSYTFADTGTYIIALVASRLEESCADTAYATIRVDQGLKIVVPNIITPNGDGRNDALVAQTAGVAFMRWEIRNRWGNLLHKSEATSPTPALIMWNPEGDDYPDGVYSIVITVKGESGELKEFAVHVTIVSK